jgi:hypothetical protein
MIHLLPITDGSEEYVVELQSPDIKKNYACNLLIWVPPDDSEWFTSK